MRFSFLLAAALAATCLLGSTTTHATPTVNGNWRAFAHADWEPGTGPANAPANGLVVPLGVALTIATQQGWNGVVYCEGRAWYKYAANTQDFITKKVFLAQCDLWINNPPAPVTSSWATLIRTNYPGNDAPGISGTTSMSGASAVAVAESSGFPGIVMCDNGQVWFKSVANSNVLLQGSQVDGVACDLFINTKA